MHGIYILTEQYTIMKSSINSFEIESQIKLMNYLSIIGKSFFFYYDWQLIERLQKRHKPTTNIGIVHGGATTNLLIISNYIHPKESFLNGECETMELTCSLVLSAMKVTLSLTNA